MKEPKLGWLARLGLNLGLAGIETAIAEIKDDDIKKVAAFALQILRDISDIIASNRTNKAQLIAELFKQNAQKYGAQAVEIALLFANRLPENAVRFFIVQALQNVLNRLDDES
jgi:hypothetical protein